MAARRLRTAAAKRLPAIAMRAALSAVVGALAGPAAAHDTWLVALPFTARGEAVVALGTGNQFPTLETPLPLAQLPLHGCRGDGLDASGMRWVADRPTALVLRSARPVAATAMLSCWAQSQTYELQIENPIVELYLDEIKAGPAIRERWAALRARGVIWQETYTKHARIELGGPGAAEAAKTGKDAATAAVPGLGMDVLVEPARRPLRVGDTLRAQVLRDGRPLAGLPVEMRSDLSPLGFWRTTDAEGRVELPLPLAANWLLRGTDLRPSPQHPDRWDSRFITLAFMVLPKP